MSPSQKLNALLQNGKIVIVCILFCIYIVPSCNAAVEFSSRPTNVSILLLHFTKENINGSVVMGTFGLWSLMACLSFGSLSDTNREIFRGFLLLTDKQKFNAQYKTLTDILFQTTPGVEISNNNFFFVDKFLFIFPDFKEMLISDYKTTFKVIDFQDTSTAASRANSIVNDLSPVNVSPFVPDDFNDATIIMGNVMYFKGNWLVPFNASNTVSLSRVTPNGTRQINMMKMTAKLRSSRMPSMKATITELPYGAESKYCMLLFYPNSNVTVKAMYRNFQSVTLRHILDTLQSDEDQFGLQDVSVMLPRIAKRSKLQLQKPFNDMGVYEAFEPKYAKFAHAVREPIYIESIEHNAIVVITESGTIAHASTPGIYAKTPDFDENDLVPAFLFFIIEKSTATIMFSGIF